MKNETLIMTSVRLLGLAALTPVLARTQEPKPADFSQKTAAIWANFRWPGSYPDGTVVAPSPDRKKSVTAVFARKTESVALTVSNGQARFVSSIEGGVGSEISWSPDSRAFFVTWSSEGLSGGFHTRVYYVRTSGLKRVDLDLAVNRAFGHLPICDTSPVNVAAVAWLEGSRRLLFTVEVPAHSICYSYGTFKACEVSMPDGTVNKRYDQVGAKKRFSSDLGPRLMDARDQCITDPKSCWAHENHPGTTQP